MERREKKRKESIWILWHMPIPLFWEAGAGDQNFELARANQRDYVKMKNGAGMQLIIGLEIKLGFNSQYWEKETNSIIQMMFEK